MYGIEVDIWADTGQVRNVQGAYSAMPQPENSSITSSTDQVSASSFNSNISLPVSLSIVVLAVGCVSFLCRSQRKHLGYNTLNGKISRKNGMILFCLVLLLLPIFIESIGTVSATTHGAAVWGSRSSGAYDTNYPPQNDWRKNADEIWDQGNASMWIAYYFSQNGYNGNPNIYNIDHQGGSGTASSKAQIYSDITNLQASNDYIAVVDFDHGVGACPSQIGEPAFPTNNTTCSKMIQEPKLALPQTMSITIIMLFSTWTYTNGLPKVKSPSRLLVHACQRILQPSDKECYQRNGHTQIAHWNAVCMDT